MDTKAIRDEFDHGPDVCGCTIHALCDEVDRLERNVLNVAGQLGEAQADLDASLARERALRGLVERAAKHMEAAADHPYETPPKAHRNEAADLRRAVAALDSTTDGKAGA